MFFDVSLLLLQDLALTLRGTGAAEQLEDIEAERDQLAAVGLAKHPFAWYLGPNWGTWDIPGC